MKKLSTLFMALIAVAAMQANTFTKVTSAPTDWSGQYLVVYENSETEAWVFNGKDEAQDYVTATIANGKIVSDDLDKYAVTVEKMEGGYSIKVGTQYMGGEKDKNSFKFTQAPILNTISMDSVVYFTSNTSVLRFNPTSTIQNNKETGIRFRYYKAATYAKQKGFQLYKGTVDPIITKIDTVSVAEARGLIDAKKFDPCYIIGVVATAPSDPGSYGNTIFWMTDVKNPTDSLEAYKISGLNGADIKTIADIPFEMGDTIMIFANGLALYNNKIYETTSGNYVETLGKSQVIDVTEKYPYSLGATYVGRTEKGAIKYDVLLTETEGTEEGLHLIITTNDSLAIAGPHTLYNDSYIDGETDVCNGGNAKLTYVSNDGNYNKYNLSATFGFGEKNYKINREYDIPGWTAEFDPVDFANDRPFIPEEGDTITCAQALSFAKSLGGEGIESDIKVYVHGWVSSNPKTQKPGQLQFYMDDTEEGSSNSPVQAYYCYEQGLDSIVKGDEVLLYGKIQLYKEKAEVSNGQIYRLNDGPRHARNIECVEEPVGAISVARAMEIGNALIAPVEQTVETPDVYTVVGYIAKVSYQTKNDTATWFMTDEKGATFGDLQAYKCYIPAMILAGDKVMVTGKIAKYQKSADVANIEFAKGTGTFVCDVETDLEVIKEQAIKLNVNKVIINGQFFILKDGKMFDGRGNVVVR